MAIIKGLHWGGFLGRGLYLMEAIMIAGQVLKSLEVLRYVILVVSKMIIVLVILGKI